MRALSFERKAVLVALGFVLACVLSLIAARTEAMVVVDTGDGGSVAMATVALVQAGGGEAIPTGSGDNLAVAVNTKDGTTLFESAFLITLAAADAVVDQTNAATAYSKCEACRSIAAAIQVILVPNDTPLTKVTPKNLATAVNEDCTSCETLALASQYVLGVSGPVGFTEKGNEQIEAIQEELKELGKDAEELSLEEIQARFDGLTARVEDVLANELVPAGSSDEGEDEEDDLDEAPDGEDAESTPEPSSTEGEAAEPTTEETTTAEEMITEEGVVTEETTTQETVVEETPPQEETMPAAPEGKLPAPDEPMPRQPAPNKSIPDGPAPEDPASKGSQDTSAPPQPAETTAP